MRSGSRDLGIDRTCRCRRLDDGVENMEIALNPKVRLSGTLLLSGLLTGLLLSWPLLLRAQPVYLGDSQAYYNGGRAAVDFVVAKLAPPQKEVAQAPPEREAEAAPAVQAPVTAEAQARGVRAISYSVLAYLLGAPNARLIGLALAQALLAGIAISIVSNLFSTVTVQRRAVAAVVFAFATPLALVACLAVPDIFTGLVILAMIAPAVALGRLSTGVRLFLAGVGAFGVSAHISHPPVAAGLAVLISAWLFIARRRGGPGVFSAWSWAMAPLVVGGLLTAAANGVAFGDASIVAKRFPLTLARSVADGPGRWYLEKHCAEGRFAICEVYPHGFPDSVTDFLWGPTGLELRATPEQMDRIRAEEAQIVRAAVLDYPAVEALHLSTGFVRQLVAVRPIVDFDQKMRLDATGTARLVEGQGTATWIGSLIEALTLLVTLVALVWFGLRFRSFSESERASILLVIAALMINAAICVFFSGVASRYGARVIWLIPLLALALVSTTKSEPGAH